MINLTNKGYFSTLEIYWRPNLITQILQSLCILLLLLWGRHQNNIYLD